MAKATMRYSTIEVGQDAADSKAVTWYWQALAFLSSWLILGGFLVLPPLAATNTLEQQQQQQQRRLSATGLIVITTACFASGVSLTALVTFATAQDARFQLTSIFLPAISCCSLGFLVLILAVGLTEPHNLTSAASIVGIVLGIVLTLTYALCAARASKTCARRKNGLRHVRPDSASSQLPLSHYRSVSGSEHSYTSPPMATYSSSHLHAHSGGNAQLQQAPYVGQYPRQEGSYEPAGQAMQAVRHSPQLQTRDLSSAPSTRSHVPAEQRGAFDTGSPIGPVQILPPGSMAQGLTGTNMVERELTRQQMLTLLLAGPQSQRHLSDATTTFRIELPRDELESAGSIFGPERLDLASPAVAAASERARLRSDGDDRGCGLPKGKHHSIRITHAPLNQFSTGKSREERRQEIESGRR